MAARHFGPADPRLASRRRTASKIARPYYLRLADNRDMTVTPHVYTEAPPMLEGQYRALTDKGAYQITGYATGRRIR